MVLYVFQSRVHIYHCLLHRLVVNKDKEAVLFSMDSSILGTELRNFKKNNLFSNVCFPITKVPSIWKESEDVAIQKFLDIYGENIKKTGYELFDFEKIYLLVDCFDLNFMLYLTLRQINYYTIQGIVNWEPLPAKSMLGVNKHRIIMKYNAYGWSSQLATPIFLSGSDESIANCSKSYELWNISACLENLSLYDLEMIEKSYNEKISDMDCKGTTLLVKNSATFVRNGLAKAFVDMFKKIYRETTIKGNAMALVDTISLDYFTEPSKVYIKTHPNQPIDDQKMLELYGLQASATSKMPMQLFAKVLSNKKVKFDTLIAYASGSLDTLNTNIFKKNLTLGKGFLKIWIEMHEIFIAVRIALQEFPIHEIYCTENSLLDTVNLLLQKEGFSKCARLITNSNVNKNLRNAFLIYDELSFAKTPYSLLHESVVLCFLNITDNYYFFNENYIKKHMKYVGMKVGKVKIQKTLDPCAESNIWLYSSSESLYSTMKDFSIRKELHFTGIEIYAEAIPLAETYNKLLHRKKENEINEMKKKVKHLEKLYSSQRRAENFSDHLQKEDDFSDYLDLLEKKQENILIICIIRTSSNLMQESLMQQLKKIGCIFDTSSKPYICVIDEGNMVFDKAKFSQAPINFKNEHLSLQIITYGNQAEISLKGINYALNKRGINIVVWDKKKMQIIDSVAFDGHLSSIAKRSKKRYAQ